MRHLVLAPNFREAQLVAAAEGLQRGEWRYAHGPHDLQGYAGDVVLHISTRWQGGPKVMRKVRREDGEEYEVPTFPMLEQARILQAIYPSVEVRRVRT